MSADKTTPISGQILTLGLIILTFYSAAWIIAKFVAVSAPPVWATIGRLIASAAFLLGVLALMPSTRLSWVEIRRRRRDLFVLSLLGTSGYLTLTFISLRSIQPSQLVAVLAMVPALTFIIAWLRGLEAATPQKVTGVVIATAAAVGFNIDPLTQLDSGAWIGVTTAGLAAVSYAFFGVRFKETLPGMPVVGVSTVMIVMGIMTLLPLALLTEGPPPQVSGETIAALTLIGAGLSAPVYLLYGKIIQLGGALIASLAGVIGPFTVLIAEALIGLRATVFAWEWICALVCTFGVALIVFPNLFSFKTKIESRHA